MSKYQTPYNGPEGPVSLSERQRLCSEVAGVVEWSQDGFWGYCACPGASFHTGKTAKRDCRVFTGLRGDAQEAPNLYCLHTSCLGPIEAATKRLQSLVGQAKAAAGRSLPPAPLGHPKQVRGASHTARTFHFRVSEEAGASKVVKEPVGTTARTEKMLPLTRFAHVRMHAHCTTEPAKETSAPYVKELGGKQPVAVPVAEKTAPLTRVSGVVDGAQGGKVFCPIRLVWITRAEWAEEQRLKPLNPTPKNPLP
jgi:hypothetical protein